MNKKIIFSAIAIIIFCIIVFGVIHFFRSNINNENKSTDTKEEEMLIQPDLIPFDEKITVLIQKSRLEDNTVNLTIENMDENIESLSYEITYDSQGLIKGVNSGSKPIEIENHKKFEREVYMGTCSRNVCKPDEGVTTISLSLEFNYKDDKKSQFSKDFSLENP